MLIAWPPSKFARREARSCSTRQAASRASAKARCLYIGWGVLVFLKLLQRLAQCGGFVSRFGVALRIIRRLEVSSGPFQMRLALFFEMAPASGDKRVTPPFLLPGDGCGLSWRDQRPSSHNGAAGTRPAPASGMSAAQGAASCQAVVQRSSQLYHAWCCALDL